MTYSLRQLQKCAEREVVMRRNVFRRRGMDPEKGAREIAMMEEIAAHFRALADEAERAGKEPDGMMFIEKEGGGGAAPLYADKAEE